MSDDAYTLDRRAMRQAFSRAGAVYDQVAVLQAEVGGRLLERLDLIKLDVNAALDLGCGTAQASQALQARYPQARVIALDAALGMLRHAPQRGLLTRWLRKSPMRVCADAYRLPLRDASVDVVFSNLMLQWCDPPDAVFAEVRRVLKPQGAFIFSSFGPDTLRELRSAWASVDDYSHVNRFIDMHDLGDAMLRAGLAEPVLDVERFTLTYSDATVLMRELKAIGAHNVNAGRRHALTGRAALQKLRAAYETFRRDDLLPASYEVVCGQAWGNANSRRDNSGEVRIPIDRIGRR